MKSFIGEKNIGYSIIAQGNKAVVGYHEGKKEYACWCYDTTKEGNIDCNLGYYTTSPKSAFLKYEEREGR